MIDKEVFSKILAAYLDQAQEKAPEFAAKCKIPPSTMRSYLAGNSTPSYQNLKAMAEAMKLSLEQLLRMGDPATDTVADIKSLIDGEALSIDAKKDLIRYLLDGL